MNSEIASSNNIMENTIAILGAAAKLAPLVFALALFGVVLLVAFNSDMRSWVTSFRKFRAKIRSGELSAESESPRSEEPEPSSHFELSEAPPSEEDTLLDANPNK